MDYGKAAYMRVDDLTKRIADLERDKTAAYGSIQFGAKSGESLGSGKNFHHVVSSAAEGACQLILRMRVNGSGSLAVKLSLGGLDVLTETVVFESGARDAFFLTTVKLERGATDCDLTLSGAFTLLSYELVAFGHGLSAARSAVNMEMGTTVISVFDGARVQIFDKTTLKSVYNVACDSAHLSIADGAETLAFSVEGYVFQSPVTACKPVPVCCGSEALLFSDGEGVVRVQNSAFGLGGNGGALTEVPVPQGRVSRLIGITGDDGKRWIAGLSGGSLYLKEPLPCVTVGHATVGATDTGGVA